MMNRIVILSCIVAALMTTQTTAQRSSYPLPEVLPEERQFRVITEWPTIGFAYRSEVERANAIYLNHYIPRNNLISDVKAFANRLYLTVPRMLPGVPATLGWIVLPHNDGRTDPEIEPFPSWEMNEIGNCSALQFVQGIAIDQDGIMYVVDSGRIDTLNHGSRPQISCPPKILLLDLRRNGTIVRRYDFPEDVAARGSNYLNKVVLDDAFGGFAYITDNSGSDPGIVVFSKRLNQSWKVREPNSMRAARNAQEFTINGTRLNFAIHIDGITIGPYYDPNTGLSDSAIAPQNRPRLPPNNYERNVYYCPLSSYHLYSLPASLLRDPEFARRSGPREVLAAVTDHGLKVSQTDGMIMDNQGTLYYGLLKDSAIAQWDSHLPFTYNNQLVIAKDDNFIQWVDGMSFDEEGYLYVVVNRLFNFVAGRLQPNDINFRILRAKTGRLGYQYTNNGGIEVPGALPGDIINRDLVLNDPYNNGIGSTTPFYSSLESVRGYYGSASIAQTSFVLVALLMAVTMLQTIV